MYTRDYLDTESVQIPQGYRGTLLEDRPEEEREQTASRKECESTEASATSSILPKPLRSLFGEKFLRGFRLGTEELLIIAAAIFLLFSKDGDKECAVLLGLLLFIT